MEFFFFALPVEHSAYRIFNILSQVITTTVNINWHFILSFLNDARGFLFLKYVCSMHNLVDVYYINSMCPPYKCYILNRTDFTNDTI